MSLPLLFAAIDVPVVMTRVCACVGEAVRRTTSVVDKPIPCRRQRRRWSYLSSVRLTKNISMPCPHRVRSVRVHSRETPSLRPSAIVRQHHQRHQQHHQQQQLPNHPSGSVDHDFMCDDRWTSCHSFPTQCMWANAMRNAPAATTLSTTSSICCRRLTTTSSLALVN